MDALNDITNVEYTNRKRLSNGDLKSYKYVRKPRKSIDINFDTDCQKLKFEEKFDNLKRVLKTKSNFELLDNLMDFFIQKYSKPEDETSDPKHSNMELFVCTKSKLYELVRLSQRYGPLEPIDMGKIGHVARLVMKPIKMKSFPVFWHSSEPLKQDFTVNNKMIHSYLCAGMYPAQYERFSTFANIGLPAKCFRGTCFRLINLLSLFSGTKVLMMLFIQREKLILIPTVT